MRILAIVLGLFFALIQKVIKIVFFPITWLIDFTPDYLFQFSYGHGFCWIDLQFPKDKSIKSIDGVELQRCYLQYLLKVLNVMPQQSIPLVIDSLGKGLSEEIGYLKITEKIFSEVLLKSLTPTQRSLTFGVDFPAMYSMTQQEKMPPQWKHYFKMDKPPSQKIHLNFDSSPTDILLPLSCGIFYGYVFDSLSPVEKNQFNETIKRVLTETKKENGVSLGSYMKLSKFARQLI